MNPMTVSEFWSRFEFDLFCLAIAMGLIGASAIVIAWCSVVRTILLVARMQMSFAKEGIHLKKHWIFTGLVELIRFGSRKPTSHKRHQQSP